MGFWVVMAEMALLGLGVFLGVTLLAREWCDRTAEYEWYREDVPPHRILPPRRKNS